MDARGWEHTQSRRSSLKRPWDEDDNLLNRRSSLWNGNTLPPIDPEPFRRPSMPHAIEPSPRPPVYTDSREGVSKRPKYEENDYRSSFRDDLSLNGEFSQARLHSAHSQHRGSIDSAAFPQQHNQRDWERGGEVGPAASQDTTGLCPRCRRLTTRSDDLHLDLESHHSNASKTIDPELALVTQTAAVELTKALNTLSSGISSARRGVIRHHDEVEEVDFPPIPDLGLKQALDWILGRICRVNELADKLVQHVQSSNLEQREQDSLWQGASTQDGLQYNMKRHLDADPDDGERAMGESGESSDSTSRTRRKSVMTIPNPEDLPSIRSHHEYHPFHSSMDGPSRRPSIMNPPPAPNRQLPSSPGRSLPSPTSANFPSPSAASYGSSSQSLSLPPPGLLASVGTHYLPSVASSHSSDSALQAHTAALQHEVSVQKIALSSLQGEHDKLLAAFSRSQTRASALEKKHSVSDNEIISLSEEKIRLQSQVTDLEKDVEDLTRSRDEARQSAVQDAAQYVEIVKKASQLEEMAAEERKAWNKLKAEMEQRIEALTRGSMVEEKGGSTDNRQSPELATEGSEVMEVSTTPIDRPPFDVKVEPSSPNASRSVGLTSPPSSHPSISQQDATKDLKAEIRRLRNRCAEVEDTLKAVREESRSVEGIVKALGEAGKSILDKADKALGSNAGGE